MSLIEQLSQSPLNREASEHDVDLVSIVQNKLMNASISYAATWVTEPEISQAVGQNTDMQKFLISRNLVFRILSSGSSYPIARFALNSPSDPNEYLQNFDDHVLSVLIEIDAKH